MELKPQMFSPANLSTSMVSRKFCPELPDEGYPWIKYIPEEYEPITALLKNTIL